MTKHDSETLEFHEDISMVTDVLDNNSNLPDTVVDCEVTLDTKAILEKLKIVMRILSLSNNDISLIVNGLSSEPIYESPFFSILKNKKYSTTLAVLATHHLQGTVL